MPYRYKNAKQFYLANFRRATQTDLLLQIIVYSFLDSPTGWFLELAMNLAAQVEKV